MKIKSFLQYLEYEKRFSHHTVIAYQNDLSQFLTFLTNNCGLSSVTETRHAQVRSWVVEMLSNGISPRTVRRKLSALKTYFRFLLRHKYIDHDPMLKVMIPKTGKRLPVFLKQEELKFLFEGVEFDPGFTGQRDRLILELLYSTGMRRTELIGLKMKDIDFEKRQIKVLGKGNKERLLPFGKILNNNILNYLEMRQTEFSDLIEPSLFLTEKGKPLYPKKVYNLVKRYLSSVSTLEKRSPHVLRHSFATHLSENGADLNAIKALLGHANLAATQVYTHNSIQKLKEIYSKAHPKARPD